MLKEDRCKIGGWSGLTLMAAGEEASRGRHRHNHHMLRLQTHGTTVNDWRSRGSSGTTVLSPGGMALFPANARHGSCANRPPRPGEEAGQLVALMTDAVLQEAAEALPGRTGCLRTATDGSVLLTEKRLFRDPLLERMILLLRDAELQGSPAGLLGQTLSHAIALHLVASHTPTEPLPVAHKGGIPRPRLRRVLDHIEGHLEEDLPLSALAAEAAMSVFHFSRAFRQSTGLSPYQYVLHRRIERAKVLLRRDELTVGEVALSIGFVQQNHFARLFQQKTGLTPTAFRRQ